MQLGHTHACTTFVSNAANFVEASVIMALYNDRTMKNACDCLLVMPDHAQTLHVQHVTEWCCVNPDLFILIKQKVL